MKRLLSILLTAALLLSLLPAAVTAAGVVTVLPEDEIAHPDFISEKEWGVLLYTNKERYAEGLAPLTTLEPLQQVGDIRAEEIVELFSHTRPDGTSCWTALDEVEIGGWASLAENIAAGNSTPRATVTQWMNSSGHKANILAGNMHMGVGHAYAAGSTYRNYWVQYFYTGFGCGYTKMELVLPEKLFFDKGTSLDDMGIAVKLSCKCGDSWMPLMSEICTGFDPEQTGTQTVSIACHGFTESFQIAIHEYSGVTTDPTCTADGYTAYTCASCDHSYIGDLVDALGHDWVAATCTAAKYCATCGVTEGDALGHSWTEADCYEPKTCTLCGLTEGTALGHDWVGPTCTDAKYCATCGDVFDLTLDTYPESEHDYANNLDDIQIIRLPGADSITLTFSEDTELEYYYDKLYLYDGSGTLIRTFTGTQAAGVTLTVPGDTVKIRLVTDVSQSKYGYAFTSITATGTGAALGHEYEAVVTRPTPTAQGYTTHTCVRCGDSYVDSYREPCLLGDVDGDGFVTDWDGIVLDRYLAGWDVEIVMAAADMDGSGEVDDWDGILLSRYLAGW